MARPQHEGGVEHTNTRPNSGHRRMMAVGSVAVILAGVAGLGGAYYWENRAPSRQTQEVRMAAPSVSMSSRPASTTSIEAAPLSVAPYVAEGATPTPTPASPSVVPHVVLSPTSKTSSSVHESGALVLSHCTMPPAGGRNFSSLDPHQVPKSSPGVNPLIYSGSASPTPVPVPVPTNAHPEFVCLVNVQPVSPTPTK